MQCTVESCNVIVSNVKNLRRHLLEHGEGFQQEDLSDLRASKIRREAVGVEAFSSDTNPVHHDF